MSGRGGLAAGLSAGFGAEVAGRLYELDSVAAGLVVRSAADVARVRVELGGLVGRWRRLLVAHTAADDGRCGVCRSWWRARRWPCPVWRAAHRSLLECVAVDGADVPVAVGSSDPGLSMPARGAISAGGWAGVATVPSPRSGRRSPRRARSGPRPRHRMGGAGPRAWGLAVALLVVLVMVVLVGSLGVAGGALW